MRGECREDGRCPVIYGWMDGYDFVKCMDVRCVFVMGGYGVCALIELDVGLVNELF